MSDLQSTSGVDLFGPAGPIESASKGIIGNITQSVNTRLPLSPRVTVHSVEHPPEFPRYRLFDIWLNTLTLDDIRSLLHRNIGEDRKFVLANQNLHGLYICTQDEKARDFFDRADYTHIDGTSLIVLGKLFGLPFHLKHRIGYMDLFPSLLPTFVENQWRVFYLGSKPEILEKGMAHLRKDYPGLAIEGHHGYFEKNGSGQNDQVIERINQFRPNILFVGMGMPLQEHWVIENFPRLEANAILCCGGMMDYLAGVVPTPPRWLGPIGFEWAYRLFTEPSRLWKRYLIEPFQLAAALAFRDRHDR